MKPLMLAAGWQRLGDASRAFRATGANPNLRRVLLSFGAAWIAEWAFTVALGVVAFRSGGPAAVGIVVFARMAPAALLAPLSGALADRFPRERVLLRSTLVRGGAIAAATVLLGAGAPVLLVYGFAVVATASFIVFRPAHSALLPALCTTPLELTSANVVRGLVDSLSTLLGPLAAALLLGVSGPAAVFAFAAVLSFVAGLLLVDISYEAAPAALPAPLRRIWAETGSGFQALVRYPDAGLLIGIALAQTFTRGCLSVFLVVIPFELIHAGEAGVGLLTAAVGAGAVAGSIVVSLVATGRKLAVTEGAGVALWGVPLSLCAAFPDPAAVFALMCIIGVGNALVDVGLFTLPARLVPNELLARVFGALESMIALTVALGSLITSLAIGLLGVRGALLVLGLPAPVAVVLAWHRLRRIDRAIVHRDSEVAVLRRVAILRPLPVPSIDNLASHVGSTSVAAGDTVFRQGDAGDRFYVIVDGEADVLGDGRLVRTLGSGECFGEIALLNDSPRTATVRARTPLRLFTITRADFLLAVNGFSAAAREAHTLQRDRLATFTPGR